MDKAALLVLVEQDIINGGAFHTFWEEDQKGLNYSILPKTLQEQQKYNSMDDICYVKSIFWTV